MKYIILVLSFIYPRTTGIQTMSIASLTTPHLQCVLLPGNENMTIQVVRQRTQESSLLLLLFSFLLPENQYTVLSVPPTNKCQFFTPPPATLDHHHLCHQVLAFRRVFLLPHSPHAVFPTSCTSKELDLLYTHQSSA